jgi:hypothetical protein
MASSNIANIEISTGAGYVFTNAADNDMVLYQTNSNNKILLGAMSNVNPNMIITPSNITLNVQGNTSNSAVKINANNNATNVATFLGSGKVGIGTETPSTTLDVAGDINFTGNLTKSGTAFSSGMAAQSNQFAVTSSTPAYGYSAGTVTVPTVSVSTLTSPSMYLGTVNLGAYGSTSLTNGSTISLNISHNIGDSNYIAYFCPEGGSNLSVTLTSKGVNSMTTAVKNISGGPLASPSFNYMLMTGTKTTSNVPLANKVTLAYSTCNLTVYSGASSTSSVKSILGAATDPQGYAVTYSNLTNPSSQYTVSGTNMTCTHSKTNRTQAVTVLATNTFNTDPTGQTITYNVTESNLAALSFTNSFSTSITTTGVAGYTYTLPATDQGLALTYSVTNNGGTTASVSGNTLSYNCKGASGSYTIQLNGGFSSSIMTEAALAYRALSLAVSETLSSFEVSFTTPGSTTWTSTFTGAVKVLIVGGGGGGGWGGNRMGGGGGGGGVMYNSAINIYSGQTYTIVVGNQGIGGSSSTTGNGSAGGNSQFDTYVANGGGGGGGNYTSATSGGGSGGGGGGEGPAGTATGSSAYGFIFYGNNGVNGWYDGKFNGGGGGGAGGAASGKTGGAPITINNEKYSAGGGGACQFGTGGAGGDAVAGAGGSSPDLSNAGPGGNATYYGSGGGGGASGGNGGNGFKGLVKIWYP